MNAQVLINAELCVRLITALGHFLWQGAILGVAAALVSLLFKRRTAALRHNLYLAILCAMSICPLLTFDYVRPHQTLKQYGVIFKIPESVMATQPDPCTPPTLPPNLDEILKNEASQQIPSAAPLPPVATSANEAAPSASRTAWTKYAPAIALVYLACAGLLMVRVIVGLVGGGRLRRRSRPVAEGELLACLARGAEALRMRFAPTLAFCDDVAVPTVVGVIRPMVLLPVAIASGFTLQQVEWLLLHELAHIRRWDHLINLFQRTVEAALFFHPAVWFVSNRIRIEREHCCDDVVVKLGGSAHEYAGALVTAAAFCTGHGALATDATLAAAGNPRRLRVRIERLLGGAGPSLRFGRGAWLGIVLLAAGLAAAFQVNARVLNDARDAVSSRELLRMAEAQNEPATPIAAEPAPTEPVPTGPANQSASEPPTASAAKPSEKPHDGEPKPGQPEASRADNPAPASSATSRASTKSQSAAPPVLLPASLPRNDSEKTAELITQLQDPDWWLRKLAVQQVSEMIAAMKPPVPREYIMLLTAKLSDQDKRVQATAVEALGKAADPYAIKHLVAVLEQTGEVADAASEALTHFPAEKVLPLLRLAAADKDMCMGALNALAKWNQPEVTEILGNVLTSILPSIASNKDGRADQRRHALVDALGRQSPERVAEKLAEAAKSADARTRIGVAQLFVPAWKGEPGTNRYWVDPRFGALYQNPRAVEMLYVLSNDAERDARAAAVDGLGGIAVAAKNAGGALAAPGMQALAGRLRDSDWSVCARAAETLDWAGWQPATPEERAWLLVGREQFKDAELLGEAAVDPLLHVLQSDREAAFHFSSGSFMNSRTVGRSSTYGDALCESAVSALGELKCQRAVPALVALLNSQTHRLVSAAAIALRQIGGAAAADALAAASAGLSENTRYECLGALATLKDPRAVAPLIALLSSENNNLRDFAMRQLTVYKESDILRSAVSTPDLIKMLNAKEQQGCAFALDVLCGRDDPQVASAIILFLESSQNGQLRHNAIEYLGAKKVAAAVDPLTKILFNEQPRDAKSDLSDSAVRALGQICGTNAFKALVEVVSRDSSSSDVVKAAVSALAATKNPEAVSPLSQLLIRRANSGGVADTQSMTADALGTLGGPDAARALADGAVLSIDRQPQGHERIGIYINALKKVALPHSSDALYRILTEKAWAPQKPGVMTREETVSVAKTLAEFGDSRAEEPLKSLTAFPDTRVVAEEALKNLQEKKGAGAPAPTPAAALPVTPAPAPAATPTPAPPPSATAPALPRAPATRVPAPRPSPPPAPPPAPAAPPKS